MTHRQTYIAVISVTWSCVLVQWVYLSKPAGSGLLQFTSNFGAVAGGVLVLLGLAVFVWSAGSLAIGVSGDATGPTALVVRGPYRHVRHPLYIAVALALVGVWVAYGRWRLADIGFLLIISLLAHLAVVRYEEAATRHRVGQVYDLYCARVPRWVPRVFPAEVADLTAHDAKAAEQAVAADRPKTGAG